MARRKKDDDGARIAQSILVGLLAAIVILLTLVSSAVLIGGWIYYLAKLRKLPKPEALSDFAHTRSEIKKLIEIQEALPAMEAVLADLWEQGAHLSKRQDSYFQERSKLGKELNPKIQQLEGDIAGVKAIQRQYKHFPQDRFDHYSHILGWYRGLTLSLFVYAGILAWQLSAPAEWVVSFSAFLNENGFLGVLLGNENLWGAMAVATGAAVLTVGLGRLIVPHTVSTELKNKEERTKEEAISYSEALAIATGIGDW